jgi:hypothetical protein
LLGAVGVRDSSSDQTRCQAANQAAKYYVDKSKSASPSPVGKDMEKKRKVSTPVFPAPAFLEVHEFEVSEFEVNFDDDGDDDADHASASRNPESRLGFRDADFLLEMPMDGSGMCDEVGRWIGGRYSQGPDPGEPLGIYGDNDEMPDQRLRREQHMAKFLQAQKEQKAKKRGKKQVRTGWPAHVLSVSSTRACEFGGSEANYFPGQG